MSRQKRSKMKIDPNPEWTDADFAKAKSAAKTLAPKVLAQFKGARGAQKSPTKIPVSIRLSPEVVKHFKDKGPGWQSRIDDALRKIAKKAS